VCDPADNELGIWPDNVTLPEALAFSTSITCGVEATINCTHSFGSNPEYDTFTAPPGLNDDALDKVADFNDVTVVADGVDVGAPAGRVVVVAGVVATATVMVVAATVVDGAAPMEYCCTYAGFDKSRSTRGVSFPRTSGTASSSTLIGSTELRILSRFSTTGLSPPPVITTLG
jgi:hypothetical protein